MARADERHFWIARIAHGAAIACIAVAAAGTATAAVADDAFGPQAVSGAAESFKVGSLQVVALHDAQNVVRNDGKVFGIDAGAEAVAELLKAGKLPGDRVTLSVNALLLRTGNRIILFDSGFGPAAHGALMSSLAEAGVSADEVTDVFITHAHGDHTGGLARPTGALAFPKAVIRMSAAEWAWMRSQPKSADLVKALDGHVQTFTPGTEVVPGVTPLALAGHTPGHVGYEITSGRQSLLDIGDLAHSSVVSLKKPEWAFGYDGDAGTARATREKTLARLAQSHELVFAPHFPFPGVGHIVVEGGGYAWVPDPR